MEARFRSGGYVAVFIAGMLVGIVFATRVSGELHFAGAQAAGKQGKATIGPETRIETGGSGPGASDEFDLAEGRARITIEYGGHSGFGLELSEAGHGPQAVVGE